MPKERHVVLVLPQALKTLGIVERIVPMWVTRALYGLKESPRLWSEYRNKQLTSVKIRCDGVAYVLRPSQLSLSLWIITPEGAHTQQFEMDENGETSDFLALRLRLQICKSIWEKS